MDRVFRIDLYPQDWLVQTAKMTPQQRGVFINIVCMIYANRGPIDNDAAHIGRASNCSSRLARSVIDQLIKTKDLRVQGEKLTQKRCELELNLQRTRHEHSAKGGRTKHENEGKFNKNNNLTSSEHIVSLHAPSHPIPSHHSKLAGKEWGVKDGDKIPEYTDEEILPSSWHDYAESKAVPDEQIYASWKKFKAVSSSPFKFSRWKAWIDKERIKK